MFINVLVVQAVCGLLLLVKMVVAIAFQIRQQGKYGFHSPNEEDRKPTVPTGMNDTLLEAGAQPVAWEVVRARRIVANDTENIPYALIFSVPFIFISSQKGTGFPSATLVGYTALRCAHSLFFALGLQPFRTIAFGVSFIILQVMTVAAVISLPGDAPAAEVALVVVAMILDIKLHLLVLAIGPLRAKLGAATLPEDEGLLGAPVKPVEEYPELLQRIDRCHRNDVENLPLGLLAANLISFFAPPEGTAGHGLAVALILLFCVARLSHTVCGLACWQPWRLVAFILGEVAVAVMLVWSVVRTFEDLPDSVSATAVRSYATGFFVLHNKMFLLALLTVKRRAAAGVVLSPEDLSLVPNGKVTTKDAMPDEVARVMRAHANDVENIPMFLFFAFMFVTRPTSRGYVLAGAVLTFIFTVSRLVHTVAYLQKLQPLRSISWAAGLLCCVTLAVLNVITSEKPLSPIF